MNNKRGISGLVTTLIMVLLVLVSIGIVWTVIKNIISGGVEQISLGQLTIDLKIKEAKIEGSDLIIRVSRSIGEGSLVGVKFAISNESLTKVIEKNTSIVELEEQTFNLGSDVSSIKEVSIAPIIKSETGKEVTGNIADTFKF
tara:strand:- start:2798 stop:3226 length:429 start_codon:yes stop_codon:yes gene_type:complete